MRAYGSNILKGLHILTHFRPEFCEKSTTNYSHFKDRKTGSERFSSSPKIKTAHKWKSQCLKPSSPDFRVHTLKSSPTLKVTCLAADQLLYYSLTKSQHRVGCPSGTKKSKLQKDLLWFEPCVLLKIPLNWIFMLILSICVITLLPSNNIGAHASSESDRKWHHLLGAHLVWFSFWKQWDIFRRPWSKTCIWDLTLPSLPPVWPWIFIHSTTYCPHLGKRW